MSQNKAKNNDFSRMVRYYENQMDDEQTNDNFNTTQAKRHNTDIRYDATPIITIDTFTLDMA